MNHLLTILFSISTFFAEAQLTDSLLRELDNTLPSGWAMFTTPDGFGITYRSGEHMERLDDSFFPSGLGLPECRDSGQVQQFLSIVADSVSYYPVLPPTNKGSRRECYESPKRNPTARSEALREVKRKKCLLEKYPPNDVIFYEVVLTKGKPSAPCDPRYSKVLNSWFYIDDHKPCPSCELRVHSDVASMGQLVREYLIAYLT